ncbi:MAG: MFS transporter [Pseudomonadota bacterium]|nr:MFS transporter [Pseudomonadota bacterium]
MTEPKKKDLHAVYAFGIFSMALIDIFVLLIPIFAKDTLGMSDGQIGSLVGARSLLSLFLSIHGGALMDRYGTRRITLMFTGAVIVCGPLFPFLSTFWALFMLQVISGFAISLGWSGAQTLIARIADGDAEYIGRFSTFARIGTTVAPIFAGFLFDVGGAWLAYGFGTLWAIVAFYTLWRVPEPNPPPQNSKNEQKFKLMDIMPKVSDYTASFALMAIPAVAFTAVAMLVRNSTYGVQTTIYVTYAQDAGLTATKIGLLFAAIELAGAIGSWYSGRIMRNFDPIRVLVLTTFITVTLVSATPLIGGLGTTVWGIFALLFIGQVFRGITQGVSQPILFSVQAISVTRDQQGTVVGLRQTMNRLGGVILPPIIGFVSDFYGREESFYIIGVGLLVLLLGLAIYGRFVPKVNTT